MRFCFQRKGIMSNSDVLARTAEQRFWKRVDKNGPVHPVCGQCRIWTGLKNAGGYGRSNTGSLRLGKTHGFSCWLHYGELPDDKHVLHKYNNPACVNPAHLFLGTDIDNVRDMFAKGGQPDRTDSAAKGEGHGMHKLIAEEVLEIRARYVPRCPINGSNAALAKEFGVTRVQIERVITRRCWGHI